MSIYFVNIDFSNQDSLVNFQSKAAELGELKVVFNNSWFLKTKTNLMVSEIGDVLSSVLTKKDYYAILPVDNRCGFGFNIPDDLRIWASE